MTINPNIDAGYARPRATASRDPFVPAPRLLTAAGTRMEVILSDIDSTLSDTRQRRFACPTVNPTRTWAEYAMLCSQDKSIPGAVRTLRMFHSAGYGVHLITGRPEVARRLTEGWLRQHEVPYEELRMRPNSLDPSISLKVAYIEVLRQRGYEPVLFLEDWPEEAAAIEAAGVPVLCINPRYRDTP